MESNTHWLVADFFLSFFLLNELLRLIPDHKRTMVKPRFVKYPPTSKQNDQAYRYLSLHIILFCLQSMYAAVHDAALVVGKAVENLLLSSDKGMQMIAKHIGNMTCPLHSAGTQHEKGLGWKLLQQIRKVSLPTDCLTFLLIHSVLRIKCFINVIYTTWVMRDLN